VSVTRKRVYKHRQVTPFYPKIFSLAYHQWLGRGKTEGVGGTLNIEKIGPISVKEAVKTPVFVKVR